MLYDIQNAPIYLLHDYLTFEGEANLKFDNFRIQKSLGT